MDNEMDEIFDNVAWGTPTDGIVCGLFFAKSIYLVGEEIKAEFLVRNISGSEIKIIRPRVMRDWIFQISGPMGGNYIWKGPQFKWKPLGEADYMSLAGGAFEKYEASLGGQIEQKILDWNSVLPGKYEIKIVWSNPFYLKEQKMETGVAVIDVNS